MKFLSRVYFSLCKINHTSGSTLVIIFYWKVLQRAPKPQTQSRDPVHSCEVAEMKQYIVLCLCHHSSADQNETDLALIKFRQIFFFLNHFLYCCSGKFLDPKAWKNTMASAASFWSPGLKPFNLSSLFSCSLLVAKKLDVMRKDWSVFETAYSLANDLWSVTH